MSIEFVSYPKEVYGVIVYWSKRDNHGFEIFWARDTGLRFNKFNFGPRTA